MIRASVAAVEDVVQRLLALGFRPAAPGEGPPAPGTSGGAAGPLRARRSAAAWSAERAATPARRPPSSAGGSSSPPPTPAGSASARRSTTSWRPTRSAAPCAAAALAAASGTLPSPMGSSARRTCSACPTGPGPSCATVSTSSRSVVTRVTRTGYAWHGSPSSSSATGMPGRLGCSRARARCECLAFSGRRRFSIITSRSLGQPRSCRSALRPASRLALPVSAPAPSLACSLPAQADASVPSPPPAASRGPSRSRSPRAPATAASSRPAGGALTLRVNGLPARFLCHGPCHSKHFRPAPLPPTADSRINRPLQKRCPLA